jgi:hypothetical protein
LNSEKFLEKKQAVVAAADKNASFEGSASSADAPTLPGPEPPDTEATPEAVPASTRQDKF